MPDNHTENRVKQLAWVTTRIQARTEAAAASASGSSGIVSWTGAAAAAAALFSLFSACDEKYNEIYSTDCRTIETVSEHKLPWKRAS